MGEQAFLEGVVALPQVGVKARACAGGFDAHARPLTGLTSTNGHRPCRPEEGVLAGQA